MWVTIRETVKSLVLRVLKTGGRRQLEFISVFNELSTGLFPNTAVILLASLGVNDGRDNRVNKLYVSLK